MANRPDFHYSHRFDCEQCQQLHQLFDELDSENPRFTRACQAIVDRIEDHLRWQHPPTTQGNRIR